MAFDDLAVGFTLGVEGLEVGDGCDALMFARAVKTETELRLLERSKRLNGAAIQRTVGPGTRATYARLPYTQAHRDDAACRSSRRW